MSANAPAEEQTQALAWFQAQGPAATLAPLLTRGRVPAAKHQWEGVARVLVGWSDRAAVTMQLVRWLADLNWPGATVAWDHLLSLGPAALPG